MPLTLRLSLGLLVSILLLGRTNAQDSPTVYAASRNAVANGHVDKSKLRGFSLAHNSFDETNVKGGVLIGFDLGLSPWFDSEVITALRPIYRTETGLSYGRVYGKFTVTETRKRKTSEKPLRVVELRARPGNAVGGMKVRTGLGLDAMSLFYHKITGETIEPTASSRSEWVGNVKGGSERDLTGTGQLVVGVYGNLNDEGTKVVAVGLIFTRSTQAPVAIPPTSPVVKPTPVAKAKAKVKAEAAPAPAPPPVPAEPDPIPERKELAPKAEAAPVVQKPAAERLEEPSEESPPAPHWLPLAVFGGVVGVFFLPMLFLLGRKKPVAGKKPQFVALPVQQGPTSSATGICTEPTRRHEPERDEVPPFVTVKLHPRWRVDRHYRLYVLRDEVLGLDLGPCQAATASQHGAVGGLVQAAVAWYAEQKAKALQETLEHATLGDLRALVAQGKGYRFGIAEIEWARIEAPSWWDSLFGNQGRLRLFDAHKGEFKFSFQVIQEMQRAIQLLPDVLGERLDVNVVLDRVKWRYVRKF